MKPRIIATIYHDEVFRNNRVYLETSTAKTYLEWGDPVFLGIAWGRVEEIQVFGNQMLVTVVGEEGNVTAGLWVDLIRKG
jgi:hypothetical protein